MVVPLQSNICPHIQCAKEELANCITHLVGSVLACLGTFFLLEKAMFLGGGWRITGAVLYGFTTVLALGASALYHGAKSETLKKKFRILDHASIYLMIAGGYSPLLLISLKNDYGGLLCIALWFITMICVLWKVFYFNMPETISLTSYMLLGWLGIFLIKPLIQNVPAEGLLMILIGGILYTVGAFFYLNDHRKYFHAIWHVFVLLASICHFIAMSGFVITLP